MRIRVPEQWRGDYLAMLGAARIGEREIVAHGRGARLERRSPAMPGNGSTSASAA